MKRFKSEFAHSYKTYSFGYCQYAELEKDDPVAVAYEEGFLPYTGSPDVKGVFYMARSARVNLKKFKENSENRRIGKKFDGKFKRNSTPIKEFDYKNPEFLNFCIEYFKKRHGEGIMTKNRLLSVLSSGLPISVATYTNGEEKIVGYVLEIFDENMGHYWYSFYDLSYAYQSLGMWMMFDSLREAKKNGVGYYYLGTVYGEKALYKTNFESLEFWTGDKWSSDTGLLRKLSRQDEKYIFDGSDRWKDEHEHF